MSPSNKEEKKKIRGGSGDPGIQSSGVQLLGSSHQGSGGIQYEGGGIQ